MYLLIHSVELTICSHILNLHPTMYLLIPFMDFSDNVILIFTSHYVSINSNALDEPGALDM